MTVTITIALVKGPKEKLSDFKKKYDALRNHVHLLQMKGTLPKGDVNWEVSLPKKPTILLPAVTQTELEEDLSLPVIAHRAGCVLMPISGLLAPL